MISTLQGRARRSREVTQLSFPPSLRDTPPCAPWFARARAKAFVLFHSLARKMRRASSYGKQLASGEGQAAPALGKGAAQLRAAGRRGQGRRALAPGPAPAGGEVAARAGGVATARRVVRVGAGLSAAPTASSSSSGDGDGDGQWTAALDFVPTLGVAARAMCWLVGVGVATVALVALAPAQQQGRSAAAKTALAFLSGLGAGALARYALIERLYRRLYKDPEEVGDLDSKFAAVTTPKGTLTVHYKGKTNKTQNTKWCNAIRASVLTSVRPSDLSDALSRDQWCRAHRRMRRRWPARGPGAWCTARTVSGRAATLGAGRSKPSHETWVPLCWRTTARALD